MEFRHGPHETRRRRLLTEDTGQSADDAPPADAPVRRAKGASSDSLPRITDLAPRYTVSFFLLFVAGVLVIAGLEALYWFMPQFSPPTTDGTIESFDLNGEGTLAVWFSSFVLTMSGFTALGIYAVCKRNEEDYHARYRVWLWAAMCWFTLSIDETGSVHEGFNELMSYLSGSRLMGDGSLWWVIAYGLVLGQLALMLWIETKGSWGCRAALIATTLCFAGAVIAHLELFAPYVGIRVGIMIEEGLEMLGDLCLLLGMGLHLRLVTRRHASGKKSKAAAAKGPKGKTKLKKTRSARAEAETPKSEKKPEPRPANEPRPAPVASTPGTKPGASITASGASPKPNPLTPAKSLFGSSTASSSSAPSSSATSSSSQGGNGLRVDTAQNGPGGTHRKLSKAERKALKREQRRSGPADDEDDE